MSEKDMRFVNAKSVSDELNKSSDPVINEQREYRKQISYSTQDMIDKLDQQRLRDIELEFMRKATREELEDSIRKLDNHSICSGNLVCPHECAGWCAPSEEKKEIDEPKHIMCCPNPRPSWFKKNKLKIFMVILWAAIIILAVGWTPGGAVFAAIQTSYVDLIVNFFKVAVLGAAGFATYKLIAKDKEDE